VCASVRGRNGDCLRLLGAAAFFRVGFFGILVRNVALLVYNEAVHGDELFIFAAGAVRALAETVGTSATPLGGELSLRDGLFALETEHRVGFADGNADNSDVDFGDGITLLANKTEAFASFRFLSISQLIRRCRRSSAACSRR